MEDPIRETGSHLGAILADGMRGDGPLYRLLATALKQAIDRGDVPLGTVLPPERALANALAVSRATVVAAYDRLKAEGWLESRRGSGTWVRDATASLHPGVDAVSTGRLFLANDAIGSLTDPSSESASDSDVIELSVAAVTGASVIADVLLELTRDDIEALTGHHGYVPQGLRALRGRVADYYAAMQLPTLADQVIVTTGAHQALSLVARQAVQPGDAVLVESPTFPGALDVFRRFGARPIPLPVDEHGARTDTIAELVERADPAMIYVAPHFHNPTGTVMPVERRMELGAIAAQSRTPVVEDLALADVAIDDIDLPPPIAALCPEATVHTIGSTAKLFWAGLRIGWLRTPESWAPRMLATKTVADLGSPLLSQLLVFRLLDRIDDVKTQRREQLRPRRDQMCALLAEHLPDWSYRCPSGGLSLWVTLPHGNADEFADVAMRHGVAIVPGPALSVDEGNRRCLRLVYAHTEADIDEGVRRLVAAWEAYVSTTTSRSSARLLV
ncbi:MAG: PLP-dependent aminotransferase family protein [Nitriliruptoraceae bacterium]